MVGRFLIARVGGDLRRLRVAELAMAPRLRPWLGAALAACVLIAAAYLPPRGGVRPRGLVFNMQRPLTAARLRAQAVGAALRAATVQLRVQEARDNQGDEVARQQQNTNGLVLLILGPDTMARRMRPAVAAALDTVWHHLGLGETKVDLVFVLDLATKTGGITRAYVFPDSSDRSTCAVWQYGGDPPCSPPPGPGPVPPRPSPPPPHASGSPGSFTAACLPPRPPT